MTSEILQEMTDYELIRSYEEWISAGRVSPFAPSARSMNGLPSEVGRLIAAGKTSPSAAASLEDIDWGGIDTLRQLVDPPPAQVTQPPDMVRPFAAAGSMRAAATPRMDVPDIGRLRINVPDSALPIVREAGPVGAAEILRLPEAYEAASQLLPLQPSSAAVRVETGAAALPPVADPWRTQPPGMGGGPRQVGFGAAEGVRFEPEPPAGSVSAGRPGIPVPRTRRVAGGRDTGLRRLERSRGAGVFSQYPASFTMRRRSPAHSRTAPRRRAHE